MRACDECSLCCKVIGVREIDKPRGQWCKHYKAGKGCAVYLTRPAVCRDYTCRFKIDPELDEIWRPSECRMVINLDRRRVVVNVDPDRPNAWREEPFYSTFKRWSRTALPGWPVFISIADEVIAVHPDRDITVQTPVPAA
jgi:Fe-S-cluster containining protein